MFPFVFGKQYKHRIFFLNPNSLHIPLIMATGKRVALRVRREGVVSVEVHTLLCFRGSQKTTSGVGLHLSCETGSLFFVAAAAHSHVHQASWSMRFWSSPVSATHLTGGVLGFQAHTSSPVLHECWGSELGPSAQSCAASVVPP